MGWGKGEYFYSYTFFPNLHFLSMAPGEGRGGPKVKGTVLPAPQRKREQPTPFPSPEEVEKPDFLGGGGYIDTP